MALNIFGIEPQASQPPPEQRMQVGRYGSPLGHPHAGASRPALRSPQGPDDELRMHCLPPLPLLGFFPTVTDSRLRFFALDQRSSMTSALRLTRVRQLGWSRRKQSGRSPISDFRCRRQQSGASPTGRRRRRPDTAIGSSSEPGSIFGRASRYIASAKHNGVQGLRFASAPEFAY